MIKAPVNNTYQAHQIIKDNPNIKPAKLQSACILSTIRQQWGWLGIEKQAKATGSWAELNITVKYFFLLSEKIEMQTCLNSGQADSRKQQG